MRLQKEAHRPQFLQAKGATTEAVKDAPDASRPLDVQIVGEVGAMPTRERTQFTYAEVQLLIDIAALSRNAARTCARRICQLKRHAATPEDFKDVLETVICLVEGRGNGNSRAGGGNTQEEEEA
ncbi:hypothetical protein FN846DRAFT_894990 [Sphaerosporella brunnea]|uniref:Uncharacterized protein n=1 Tax=Sphaerosporella brunnea TaxID=1250544 RepID=A0A5J5EGZ9_9PEZI|nr:hypothetical protein FN846DRAFT_894990 [Sphaerosporella brunnea]